MVRTIPSFRGQVLAVNRVESLLRKVAEALDGAGVLYAVIGGNAVAAWVGQADRGAVRATKDVDILLRRSDLAAATAALDRRGFDRIEVFGVTVFVERADPLPSQGVHVVFASELVRPGDPRPAPDLTDAVRADAGFRVLDLASLVRMKLEAFRRVDQVHVEDLLRLGLIDASVAGSLPPDLLDRLRHVRDTMEWQGPPPEF